MRQVILDTETTGLEPDLGHRVIEIGGVEVINRRLTGRHFHKYINPQREIDDGAFEVHGISQEFLADKPVFEAIWEEFVDYITGAELVIHNAPFDVSFLNYELARIADAPSKIDRLCTITDSLVVARNKHPGQKNNLDALCRRYDVDNSQRQVHGALLDAEILADVYLLMTGGQTTLFAQSSEANSGGHSAQVAKLDRSGIDLPVVSATVEETAAHEAFLDFIATSDVTPVWRQLQ